MAARRLALVPALLLAACGSPEAPKRSAPRKLENQSEIAMHKEESAAREEQRSGKAPRKLLNKKPMWQREAPAMPPAFANAPSFDLAALEGIWVVASDIPGQRELWLVEDQGRKLTIVDVHGQERLHGLALLSPCSLQVTDDHGRSHARSFARVDERLLVHPQAGVGLVDREGVLIACIGSEAFTVDEKGKCTAFSEVLGVWSERDQPCERKAATPEQPASLRIGEHELIDRGTIWSEALAEDQAAERFGDRAGAEQALAAKPEAPTPEPTAPSEPGTTTG